ncbi:MAG TPA: hypothetical protein VED40_03205 [Azospirillaceae bacterium]|nr:hypothetical protein [Azospirillaceae bacterium]
MLTDDLLQFVRSHLKTVWALDILMLLRRTPDRAWTAEEIVQELRSSAAAVNEALTALRHGGLVGDAPENRHRYLPASPELDSRVAAIQSVYTEQPMALIRTILSAPNAKIRSFADAFKLSKD